MPISKIVGKAQTVLGPVDGSELGITLPHEHLTVDHAKANFSGEPADPEERVLANKPVCMEILHWLSYNHTENKDNLRMPDEKVMIEEVMLFKKAGGKTIVEMSNVGINRDPEALVRISKATGLNIIMGAGYYLNTSHPSNMSTKTEEIITEEIVRDITVGVGNSDIRSGIIGEIGCIWPLHPDERKTVRAAAKAQQLTGASLNIHPGRNRKAVSELVSILEEAGSDLSRVIMSHVDCRVRSHKERCSIAETGCNLEYDNFGWEGPRPVTLNWDPTIDIPSDTQRIKEIMQLIEMGYINQILISLDICMKRHLICYGGKGYNHLSKYVLPLMLRQGMTQQQIDTIMIDNPKRLLTFC